MCILMTVFVKLQKKSEQNPIAEDVREDAIPRNIVSYVFMYLSGS